MHKRISQLIILQLKYQLHRCKIGVSSITTVLFWQKKRSYFFSRTLLHIFVLSPSIAGKESVNISVLLGNETNCLNTSTKPTPCNGPLAPSTVYRYP